MLKLYEIVLKNFLSHTDTRLELGSKEGLVLISGRNNSGLYDSNGSGKSSILESIVYAISGDTLRGLSANDVINRNVKKDTKVSLRFSNDSGEYLVERYRKDTINGDKLDLWDVSDSSSPKNISKRLNKDTQSLLDNIIDIPYEVLKNTIFLGEGLSSRFTQLSDPSKKSLIESTLNLSYDLSKCRDLSTSRLKELQLDKSNKEGQLRTLETLLSEDINTIDSSISSLSCSIENDEKELATYIPKRDEIQSLIPAIYDKIDLLKKSITEYNTLYTDLNSLDTETANMVNEITKVESSDIPECALCHQRLSSEESRSAVISNYRERIDKNTSQMREWQSKLDSLPNISILNSKLDELQRLVSEYHQSLTELQGKITSYITSIESMKIRLEHLKELKGEIESYQSQYDNLTNDISVIDKDISRYEYFQRLFSPTGIITYILEDAISYINTRIKAYTDILLDKTYKLVLSKGKISLEDSGGSTYQSLSNGEKRRLDIAIQFSLHDYVHIYCGIGTNLLFIDEILDTLDATGVNNIIEVLTLKREYCKLDSIYVITHNNELKSYFDDIITVSKDSIGNSSIVKGG